MIAFILYLGAVVTDGDWRNDWLGHLPPVVWPVVAWVGAIVARVIGA
jgi:hypothetical protein